MLSRKELYTYYQFDIHFLPNEKRPYTAYFFKTGKKSSVQNKTLLGGLKSI